MYIEEVDLGAIRRARCGPDEPGCEADPRHLSLEIQNDVNILKYDPSESMVL
jgi:hypothetical protein